MEGMVYGPRQQQIPHYRIGRRFWRGCPAPATITREARRLVSSATGKRARENHLQLVMRPKRVSRTVEEE